MSAVETCGLLTVKDPIVCRDGEPYLALYADRWTLVPGDALGIESAWTGRGAQPQSPWFAVAVGTADEMLAVIPGDRIAGLLPMDDKPEAGDWFDLTQEE